MRALITGGTGFIGRHLVRELEAPIILSRHPENAGPLLQPDARIVAWSPEGEPAPAAAFEGVQVIYHLAGQPVAARRWDERQKERIRASRVLGTRNLVRGLELAELDRDRRPRVLVAASATGIYGDRGDEELDEESPLGTDFLAWVCRDWEAEAARAAELGVRVVRLRIGVVLGRGGGALARMLPAFRLGLGGRLGSGRQWMPWIHLDDLIRLMLFAAAQPGLTGAVNAVAPQAVTNHVFTRSLGRVLRRPTCMAVPEFALRLATGELAGVLLGSQRVLPRAALDAGYSFVYADLDAALAAAVGVE